jgi:membrane dipeptidase
MLRISVLSVTLLFLCAAAAQNNVDEHARRLQSQVIGIDGHNDTVQRILYAHADLAQRSSQGMVDLPRLRDGGMHAPFFALWVPTYYKGAEAVRRTLDLRDAMQRLFDQHPDQIELATTATDLERIVKSGKIAAVLSVEGGHQIDNDLAVLRMYYRMGVRSMTLTHFRNTDWADSSTDQPAHNGLTNFGRDVVQEMNRLGMIVDVSHVSDKTFYDTLAATTKPVIASHSGVRALSPVPRNMTDDMLRALAKNGGVVGINFAGGFVNRQDAEATMKSISSNASEEPNLTGQALDDYAAREFAKDAQTAGRTANATLKDVADQIDYVVKLIGIDHVGIGSDFDGIPTVPKGLEDVSKMPALTAELIRRGYSDDDIRKIMGGNFLRVMRAVIGK